MKCQCKKSLNAPTESGVVVRVSGLYAKHSHSTQDGVEFIGIQVLKFPALKQGGFSYKPYTENIQRKYHKQNENSAGAPIGSAGFYIHIFSEWRNEK